MGWIFIYFFFFYTNAAVWWFIYFNQIRFIQIQCEVWCWLFSFFPSLFWKLCIIPTEECIFPLELSLSDKNWFFSSNPLCMQDGDHWELEVCSFCIYFFLLATSSESFEIIWSLHVVMRWKYCKFRDTEWILLYSEILGVIPRALSLKCSCLSLKSEINYKSQHKWQQFKSICTNEKSYNKPINIGSWKKTVVKFWYLQFAEKMFLSKSNSPTNESSLWGFNPSQNIIGQDTEPQHMQWSVNVY